MQQVLSVPKADLPKFYPTPLPLPSTAEKIVWPVRTENICATPTKVPVNSVSPPRSVTGGDCSQDSIMSLLTKMSNELTETRLNTKTLVSKISRLETIVDELRNENHLLKDQVKLIQMCIAPKNAEKDPILESLNTILPLANSISDFVTQIGLD